MDSAKHHFLDTFFYPRSIAVIGAGRSPDTLNFNLVGNLVNLKFGGRIYPVNPNADEILGLKAYPDLRSIEADIDLAVVAVPATKALEAVKDCVAKRVKCLTLVPGGFSEIGEDGKKLQNEIFDLLRESKIRAIGPNTLSPINSRNNLVISFSRVEKLPQGKLSLIFQSGLYEPRLRWLFWDFHIHLSKLIDLGNKMDVNEVEVLEYLSQDTETGCIAMHLESIAGDPKEFMQLLQSTTRDKPVVVLKSGRTEEGAKAASSHTGAIIRSSDAVVEAALRQSGAIRAQGLDEFFDLAKIFEYLPPLKKNRISVATGSGGEGVIATDLCRTNGFTLAQLSSQTKTKLRSVFPPWDIGVNPLDIGVCSQFNWGTNIRNIFLEAIADDHDVDCLALSLDWLNGSAIDIDKLVEPFREVIRRDKPVVTWITDPHVGKEVVEQLELNRIPVYTSAERAIGALGAFYRYHRFKGMTEWREGGEEP
jgi:acetyltransferase